MANAVRTSACGTRDDGRWPGKRGPHRPPAVPFQCGHHASRPWPSAGCGSGRVRTISGRRPSPCDQCGSTAATGPRRGRPQAPADGNGRRAGRSRARYVLSLCHSLPTKMPAHAQPSCFRRSNVGARSTWLALFKCRSRAAVRCWSTRCAICLVLKVVTTLIDEESNR